MDHDFWAECWANKRTRWDRGEVSPALAHWLGDSGQDPEHILVPGCGSGHEVLWLVQRGLKVTAVDLVTEPLQWLQQQLDAAGLSAELVQADLFEWWPEHRFDAIYEQTCLCAIPPARRCEYAQRLHGWLRPGGSLFAMFAQTPWEEGPPWHCAPAEMRRECFVDRQWHWPDAPDVVIPHPAGFEEHGYHLLRR